MDATQDAEPGQQPLRLGLAATRNAGAGYPPERVLVDQRRHGDAVLTELEQADCLLVEQHLADGVVRAHDAVATQVEPDLADRLAGSAQVEGVADRQVGVRVELDGAVCVTPQAGDQPSGDVTLLDRLGGAFDGALARRLRDVLVDGAEQGARQALDGGAVGDLPEVSGEHLAAGRLDAVDDLALHLDRPDEPVEVGDDEYVGAPVLDGFDGGEQSRTFGERLAPAHVQLVVRLDQLQPLAFAEVAHPFALNVG